MIDYHNIENALLTLSFDYSTIRNVSKAVNHFNEEIRVHYIPVVVGNVSLTSDPSGDCYVTIQQIADTGEFESVIVLVPAQGSSEDPYICRRFIHQRCGL